MLRSIMRDGKILRIGEHVYIETSNCRVGIPRTALRCADDLKNHQGCVVWDAAGKGTSDTYVKLLDWTAQEVLEAAYDGWD